ncbi:MAG: ASCH domain-containing protein [Parcubacteria group bacterium]|nr:ASCH domain-containing protein [Parcubacteria group bacterium]
MKHKAISLKQPWANLVCSGKKTIETRKWNTKYRGDIVICSSQMPKIEPYGKALCIVEVYHTEPMKKEHEKKACIKVYPRAWAWHLRNIRLLKKPIPIKGQLGIYEIDIL